MLAERKNGNSLALYQPLSGPVDAPAASNGLTAVAAASVVSRTGSTVSLYHQEYRTVMNQLNLERSRLAFKVEQGLLQEPAYKGARGDGVSLAWKYEYADVKMGGKGSANWNRAEREELLAKGRVQKAEGHHQKNVSGHLKEQANPDNIKFYKSKQEHLEQGHQGNFRNETDAPMIDKNRMLRRTNRRRVAKQELGGFLKVSAMGLGIGFSLTFLAELAKSDLSPEAVEAAVICGGIGGIQSAAFSAAGYGVGMMTSGFLQKAGVELSSKAGMLLNGTAAGILTIALVSAYQLTSLQLEGEMEPEALGQVGRNAMCSVSVLAVSIAAQAWIGGPVGILVSSAAGLALYVSSLAKTLQQRQMEERLREFAIEQYMP